MWAGRQPGLQRQCEPTCAAARRSPVLVKHGACGCVHVLFAGSVVCSLPGGHEALVLAGFSDAPHAAARRCIARRVQLLQAVSYGHALLLTVSHLT